uniref:Co-chaperone protein p23 n=1 Tax=Aegilops tauschii subsp. strangulata TaxID=200361 RepID=A0A453I4E6_AEGTS
MACSRQPEVLWAQCSKKVYLTISVPDSEDVVIKTEPQGIFSFSAVAHGESFSLALELFDSVLPEVSICGRQFYILIQGWFQLMLISVQFLPLGSCLDTC